MIEQNIPHPAIPCKRRKSLVRRGACLTCAFRLAASAGDSMARQSIPLRAAEPILGQSRLAQALFVAADPITVEKKRRQSKTRIPSMTAADLFVCPIRAPCGFSLRSPRTGRKLPRLPVRRRSGPTRIVEARLRIRFSAIRSARSSPRTSRGASRADCA